MHNATVRIAVASVLATIAAAKAQEGPTTFKTWLNDALAKRVAVAISTRSNANQAEAPSVSANTTSLVDTSSASDLVGMALNLSGLGASTASDDEENDATTGAVTASAYVLWAAAMGKDPLAPDVYCGRSAFGPASWWRRVSFTLGLEDEEEADTGENSPVVAGTKAVLWTERDVCDEDFTEVQQRLEAATQRVSAWSMRVEDRLYALWEEGRLSAVPRSAEDTCPPEDQACSRRKRIRFLNQLQDAQMFRAILGQVNSEQLVDLITDEELRDLVNLDQTAREAIDRFRGQPQLSASFTTKQRDTDGVNEYRGQLVFDKGLNERLAFSGNASWDGRDGDDAGMREEGQGGRVAAALQYEPFKDPLFGPKPLRITLGGEGAWLQDVTPTYKGQLKLNLPIPRVLWLTGVEIPISLTVANRTELVDESEVRGLVGFTIDTSQLLAAIR
jgi:hypothetical protein